MHYLFKVKSRIPALQFHEKLLHAPLCPLPQPIDKLHSAFPQKRLNAKARQRHPHCLNVTQISWISPIFKLIMHNAKCLACSDCHHAATRHCLPRRVTPRHKTQCVERSTIIQEQRGANVKHQAIDESKCCPKHADTNLVICLGHTTCARAQFFKKSAGHEMQRQQHAQGNLQGSEAKKREMRKSEGM